MSRVLSGSVSVSHVGAGRAVTLRCGVSSMTEREAVAYLYLTWVLVVLLHCSAVSAA